MDATFARDSCFGMMPDTAECQGKCRLVRLCKSLTLTDGFDAAAGAIEVLMAEVEEGKDQSELLKAPVEFEIAKLATLIELASGVEQLC